MKTPKDITKSVFDNQIKSHHSLGQKTQKTLKKKGIKSPSIQAMVHVKGRTSMVPKVDVSTPEKLEAWKQSIIEKYNL